MVVGGGGPEPEQVRAEVLHDVGGVHAVAEALVHRAALAVHGPAVGQAGLEGRAVSGCADGDQQARLEPAAVLIRALDIDVGGPVRGVVALQEGDVGRAGVKPAVERVAFLVEGLAAAVRADEALRDQLHRVLLKPDIGAVIQEQLGDVGVGLLVADGLAAVLAVEDGDRQTPAALAGDAPVVALADHRDHAVLAPGGEPAHVLTGGNGFVLEGVHGAEPLRGSPEDDGALAAPAVGIGVDDVLGGKEHTAFLHVRQNDGVGLVGLHPGVLAGVVGVAAQIVHGDDELQTVAHTGQVVLRAEAGGGVDAARAGVHRDVVRVDQQRGLGQEGVVRQHILEEGAGVGLDDLPAFKAADLHDLLGQSLGHDVQLAVGGLDDDVALAGMEGDAHVAGQGPDRGRPDHEVELAQIEVRQLALVVVHRELDVDRGAGVVLVLDLSLGQSGLVLGTPVDGLEALVDVALAEHLPEDLDLLGLELLVHRAVGMRPIGHDAEALEALALPVHVVQREVAAGGAEIRYRHGLAVELVLLDDGGLDRHAVVVPAGDVGGVIAAHGPGTDDKVLEGLVQRVAHVDVAVGERRAVVEDELGLARVLLAQLVVDVDLVPALEHAGLPLGQPAAHGKVRLRGDDGVFVIHIIYSFGMIFSFEIEN